MRRLPAGTERPSRSARKRAAGEVTELAHQLAELPEAAFRRLPLPEELRAEFAQVRTMKASAARERQLRHLGGVLRDDAALQGELQAELSGHSQVQRDAARALHRLEELRARLLDPATAAMALAEVAARPGLDLAALQQQLERHRRDGDKKAFRAIFRLLAASEPA